MVRTQQGEVRVKLQQGEVRDKLQQGEVRGKLAPQGRDKVQKAVKAIVLLSKAPEYFLIVI